jgi:hypothetical protein
MRLGISALGHPPSDASFAYPSLKSKGIRTLPKSKMMVWIKLKEYNAALRN